jgi:hypothetical protein
LYLIFSCPRFAPAISKMITPVIRKLELLTPYRGENQRVVVQGAPDVVKASGGTD